jgi:hypothetical protein
MGSKRPSAEGRTPDIVHFYLRHSFRGGGAYKEYSSLAADVAGAAVASINEGLFVDEAGEPVMGNCTPMGYSELRRLGLGKVPLVTCHHDGSERSLSSGLWAFPLNQVAALEHPWVFANDCADRIGEVFEGSDQVEPHDRNPHADLYLSGPQFIRHIDYLGYVAHHATEFALPQTERQFAETFANIGQTIVYAVTGANLVPRVSFNVE